MKQNYLSTSTFIKYLCFGILVYLGIGCRKEIIIDNTDNQYPIQLTKTTDNNQTIFLWEKANITTFKKYILVGNSVELSFGIKKINPNQMNFYREFTDINTTSHKLSGHIQTTENFYFKLYIDVGNRLIESPNVLNTMPVISFDKNYRWFTVSKSDSTIYLASSSPRAIAVVNYKNGLNLDSESESNAIEVDFQQNLLLKTKENNLDYLYLIGRSAFVKFNLPQLSIKNEIPTNFIVPNSIVSNNKDIIFTSYDDTAFGLNVIQFSGSFFNEYDFSRVSSGLQKILLVLISIQLQ